MAAERVRLQSELLRDLRYYFSDPASLLRQTTRPTVPVVLTAIARFDDNGQALSERIRVFCTADGSAFYQVLVNHIAHTRNHASSVGRSFAERIVDLTPHDIEQEYNSLADHLDRTHERVSSILRAVPMDWQQVAFPRGDRLAATAYLANLSALARMRIDVVDRYLDHDPLHILLRDVPRQLEVRLVTTAGQQTGRPYGVLQVAPFARVAKTQYPNLRLIEADPQVFHNRYLRVDDRIFVIDQSLRDLSLRDSAHVSAAITDAAAQTELDGIIAAGREIPLT